MKFKRLYSFPRDARSGRYVQKKQKKKKKKQLNINRLGQEQKIFNVQHLSASKDMSRVNEYTLIKEFLSCFYFSKGASTLKEKSTLSKKFIPLIVALFWKDFCVKDNSCFPL